MRRRIGPRLALALVLGAWAASSGAASAQDRARVLLVSTDDELITALDAALAPWDVDVVVTADETPRASMPSASDAGATLARAHDALAVAWISSDEVGPALWMYDRATDRVLARRLPTAPPFDEATAAAVAQSIKTLLRHSAAAPADQRIREPASASVVRLELGAGTRALATSPPDAEPRATLGFSAWPLRGATSIGISIAARGGTGIGVTEPDLVGRLWTWDLHVGIRARFVVAGPVDLGFGVEIGASLLDLEASAQHHVVSRLDLDPTGHAWAELGVVAIPALRIALRAGAVVNPTTRAYLVRGSSQLETQLVAFLSELVLEVPIDGGALDVR